MSPAPPSCLYIAPLSHKRGGHVRGELKSNERKREGGRESPGLNQKQVLACKYQFALIVVLCDTSYLKGSSNF